MVALIFPLRQQRTSIKRRNHKLLHDPLDQKLICAFSVRFVRTCADPLPSPSRLPVPSLTAFFDLGSRASHLTHHANVPPGLTDIPSSHSRLVRSRLNTLYLRISRRRRPSVFGMRYFCPSGARFTRYETNGSSAACSFYCTCVAVAMTVRMMLARARRARVCGRRACSWQDNGRYARHDGPWPPCCCCCCCSQTQAARLGQTRCATHHGGGEFTAPGGGKRRETRLWELDGPVPRRVRVEVSPWSSGKGGRAGVVTLHDATTTKVID